MMLQNLTYMDEVCGAIFITIIFVVINKLFKIGNHVQTLTTTTTEHLGYE